MQDTDFTIAKESCELLRKSFIKSATAESQDLPVVYSE
jgi:hypothetical protein